MTDHFFSLILPFYKQTSSLLNTIAQYEKALTKFPGRYEMILVMNGMPEAEAAQLPWEELHRWQTVKVLVSEKAGWGLAVKLGLQAAKGETICFLNSARTSPADLLAALLFSWANPNTVLKVDRKIRDNILRRVGSFLYNIECRMLFDLSYWDINGTPKIFPRKFAKLLDLKQENDLLDLEFNIICRRENYPILEIPTFSVKRQGGVSTTTWRSAVKLYVGAYRLWVQEKHAQGSS